MKERTVKSMKERTVKGTRNNTSKGAINRTNLENTILKILQDSEKPLSTSEISQILNKSWHTIIRHCLDLENKGKLTKIEVGRINIWEIKK